MILPDYTETMTSVLEIEQAIGELPRSDRSYLATKIIEGLDSGDVLSSEEIQGLDKRVQKAESGESPTIKSEDLHAEVKARLGL